MNRSEASARKNFSNGAIQNHVGEYGTDMNLRGLQKANLLFHTAKYLRPVQVLNRIKRRIIKPTPAVIGAAEMPVAQPAAVIPPLIARDKEFFKDGTVRFLNASDNFETHRWGHYPKPLLWHYNLHYFNDLRMLNSSLQAEMIRSWVAEVAPGTAIAWDAYPTSLRTINWIFWHIRQKEVGGEGLDEAAMSSLRIQLDYLRQNIEWHLLGNHLFENGKSLLIGGLFFEGSRADKLRDKGVKILRTEVDEQILADGAHFELSPMYHALILEGLLEIVAILKLYPHRQTRETKQLLAKIDAKIPKMFHWLARMIHGDGGIAFFNDATFGIAPTFVELKNLAEELGYSIPVETVRTENLTESGYCRLEKADAVVIADFAHVGPDYLPGHAHADTLSFEFSLGKDRIFVNSGTSVYEVGRLRSFQRSTAAHNTVEVESENSSEVWAGFRVAHRARVHSVAINSFEDGVSASASHDGYQRLKPTVTHKRKIELSETSLTIADQLDHPSNATARFYLHPNCRVETSEEDGSLSVKFADNCQKELSIAVADADVRLVASHWYPEFGVELDNQCIELKPHTTQCTVKINWYKN